MVYINAHGRSGSGQQQERNMDTQVTLKKSTQYVVLNDERTPGTYSVWSEHKTESGALDRCRAMGKNGTQGHTVVVPVAELSEWKLA